MFYISNSIFQKLLSFSSTKGIDINDLIMKAKVEKSLLESKSPKIPLENYYAIMDAAIEMTGDDYFGIHMGETATPGDLSILGYIMANCRILGEAFEKIGKYFAIIGSTQRLILKIEGDEAKLIWDMAKYFPNKCIKHCIEMGLSNTFNMVSNIADGPLKIKEVWIKDDPPDDVSEYNRIFNCPVLFNKPTAALVFPSEAMGIPLKHPNHELLLLLEHHANSFLSKIDKDDRFSRKVSLWFFESLPGNSPTIEEMAKDFGMSKRVLQNKLKDEGVTFSELATNVRLELAKSYLTENRYTIDDITYLVGFSEPSVFRRAFKRWTGVTASQYRSSQK